MNPSDPKVKMMYEVHDLSYPLNMKIWEAYEKGYTPIVEIRRRGGYEDIPAIVVTFFPQSHNDKQVFHED